MKVKVTQSYLTLCRLYPWTIWSMEFSRPKYWSGWLFISPRDLPNPGIGPRSPTLQADSLLDEPPGKPKNTGVGSLSLLLGNLRNQTRVFHTAGGFFTSWATKHAAFITETYKESYGLKRSRFPSRFQKSLPFFSFFFKAKWVRKSQVWDKLVYNSLIGWWWYNKLVS